MKGVEENLKGIYRDLRNQRLLPVVAILIVAIVVVPMALGAGGEEAPPQTQLAVAVEPLAEAQPVVLPATPELRNFHKRLNEFAKKNPFHQPQALPEPKSDDGAKGGTTDTGATTDTPTSTPETGAPDTGVTDTSTTDTGSSDTGSTDTGTTGDGSTDTGESPGSGAQVLYYDIDVLVGAVGDEEEIDGVKSLDLLPGDSHPVLQYVASGLSSDRASFIVSNAVTNADGDGRCAPSRFDCEFLQLKIGQSEKLVYGPTSRTYRIKLLAINPRFDPIDAVGDAADDVSGRIGFSAGLPTFTPAG